MDLAGIGLSLVGAALRSTPAAHSQQYARAAKLAIEHASLSLKFSEKGEARLAFQELESTYQFLGVMRTCAGFFKDSEKLAARERVVLEKIVEAREKFLARCLPEKKEK